MAAIVSLQITPTVLDGRIRYGDAPVPTADVTASAVSNSFNNPTGSAFSLDGGDYFSGTDVGSGTVTFIETVGTLAAVGLSFAGDTISGSTPTIGSVTGKFRWTLTGDANDFRDTNEFTISFAVPGFADTTAPTKVIGVTASRSGSNVTLEYYPSSDPHDGVSAGSGIAKYEAVLSNSVVNTKSSGISAEPSPEWISFDIGDLAVSGASTRSGAGGTAQSVGWIGENNAPNAGVDKFHVFRSTVHGGDFRVSMRVDSMTQGSASISAKFGLMCRFGLGADAPFVFAQVRPDNIFRLEYRSVAGGNRTTLGSGSISIGGYIMLELVGSVFSMYAGNDGNSLGLVASVTLTPAQSFYLMGAICGTSDIGVFSAAYSDFSFTTGARISQTFSSSSTGPFTVRAVDDEDNTGSASGEVTVDPVTTSGLFPGTNIRLNPGYIIGEGVGLMSKSDYVSKLNTINNRWYQFFTTSPNRSVSYRPPGIVGAILMRSRWRYFFANENTTPPGSTEAERLANISNYQHPMWDWSILEATFNLPCVLNDNAYVSFEMGDTGFGSPNYPAWMYNAPYQSIFIETSQNRHLPCYHRFVGPDKRGVTNAGGAGYDKVVEVILAMHTALRDKIISMGVVDKVHNIGTSEMFLGTPILPPDWDVTNWYHGIGLIRRAQQALWEPYNVFVSSGSGGGTQRQIQWDYTSETAGFGMGYPDVKLSSFANFPPDARMQSPDGTLQYPFRPCTHSTQTNGIREFTFFPTGFISPWTHNGVSVPQIAEHVVWALSGAPKGTIKDSGAFGLVNSRAGDDPPGPLPCHHITPQWSAGNAPAYAPTLADWHRALDIFGPPGTFAFPHLPEGYVP